ncbi:type II toxin-antitoxin system VapC family toxin [Roseomonas gilardii]|uniref:type II toxin-antitoxin system VapC family toxin n=1 Tax=Roseomonas gilardii TaxID=257708 RepID=UPI001B7FCA66|nr:hypothetical protein [Roseomonas gilardii]
MTLVDTNILLNLTTDDPNWVDWSIRQLDAAAVAGPLLINDIVYAELSVRFPAIEAVDAFLEEACSSRCPGRPCSWLASPFRTTGHAAGHGQVCFRTS